MQRVDRQSISRQTLPSLGLGPLVGDTGARPNAVQGPFQAAAQRFILGPEGKAQNTVPCIPHLLSLKHNTASPCRHHSQGWSGVQADGKLRAELISQQEGAWGLLSEQKGGNTHTKNTISLSCAAG